MLIADNATLKTALKEKRATLAVSRGYLNQVGNVVTDDAWVEIGFRGSANLIQLFNFWLMSHFSVTWEKEYLLKRLNYRYKAAKKSAMAVVFIRQ
ncbi:hypothetical protein [Loigolactobacillus backii]|uniref:Uncharacterized protein n=1 Tax=Loigolactobacillus backii TaxID=375175 RepID=A0A192GZ89_9LACO|nr:hypothetical protein [Loigolactobacillus backii]ANK58924.1 hypothetical protein AYR52_00770 [Loigolactobacillus backii]ANK61405.1 hypothetical protein AYR53_00710 [Loigolactobacillus backii]ANK63912.1 hypothetical protein AYR54_00755 [Loigolactobacillus backii]ANK66360.1 hypothetical protein AYR55_00760 [Loigolactobacillus backii]ANK69395.1 hypothetical protein AYR56_04005 [Loigolactobacillus backii]